MSKLLMDAYLETGNKVSDDGKVEKDTAYYSALIDAWINTKMERDKSLLALSTGGIGLLITLLTTDKVESNIAFYIAIGLFLLTIIFALTIFALNAWHIECLLKIRTKDPAKALKVFDILILIAFGGAIVSTIFTGITSTKNNKKEISMSTNKEIKQDVSIERSKQSLDGIGNLNPMKEDNVTRRDSLYGIGNLNLGNREKFEKSLVGIGNLNPKLNQGNTGQTNSNTPQSSLNSGSSGSSQNNTSGKQGSGKRYD